MPPNRTRRTAWSERACLQCQKRKTRCIPRGADQTCEYCEKSQRECTFPERPPKTSLTRKNLDDAESRCEELESLLERYRDTSAESNGVRDLEAGQPQRDDAAHDSARNVSGFVRGDTAVDASPYEWDESLVGEGVSSGSGNMQDGMVSLGGSNVGTGYLGTTSGRAILETISSAFSPDASSNVRATHQQEPPPYNTTHPLSRNLATSIVHDQLVSAYFECYNRSYPILHEGMFRAQYAARHRFVRDDSWQMVLYMVLAIGEWAGGFSNEHHSVFYDAARSRFRPESLEKGNLTTVQAFLLMSNYLQKRDRPNTAFNVLGIAHRMAFGLGLHREPNQYGDADTFSRFRRRTLFWILYCFDSGFSITTGRPGFMCDAFIDVNIPHNLDDTRCEAPDSQPNEVLQPTCVSAIIAQARLAKVANKAYAQFSGVSPCTDVDHQTSIMEHMLDTWRNALPEYFYRDDVPSWFLGSRKIVLWKQSNVRILLLLASQRQRTDLYEKITVGQRYQSVATDTLVDICTFLRDSQILVNQSIAWYAVYFVLQAALALSVHEMARSTIASLPSRQGWEGSQTYDQLMNQTRSCLQHLAQFDRNCARALHGLAQLQSGVVQSRTESNLPLPQDTVRIPTEPNPPITNTFSDLQPTETCTASDMTNRNGPSETANPPDAFPYGNNSINVPGFHDAMDFSFPAFDNGQFLAGIFQDCYGPFQFAQGTQDND